MHLSIYVYICRREASSFSSSSTTPQSQRHFPPPTQIPVLHESWSWPASDAGPTGGIGPGAGKPGTASTFTVPSQGNYVTTWF